MKDVEFRKIVVLIMGAIILSLPCFASARELKSIGVSLGELGNPFFIAMKDGIEARAKAIDPTIKVTTVSSDYDINKQFNEIDNFISSGVDLILLNAADPVAIEPAIKRAQAAGIIVVAMDVLATGSNATVQTDNVKAGEIACEFLSEKLNGTGKVILMNGPSVSSVKDRVKGCKSVLAKGKFEVLSDNQNGRSSREGGLAVAQSLLTRYPHIDAMFTVNDQEAVGADLAARQLNRKDFIIATVDGSPEAEAALKSETLVQASVSQDPYAMAMKAVDVGNALVTGKLLQSTTIMLQPGLVTRANVKNYVGWSKR